MKRTLKLKLLLGITLVMTSSLALSEPAAKPGDAITTEPSTEKASDQSDAEESSTAVATKPDNSETSKTTEVSSDEIVERESVEPEKILLSQDSVVAELKARYKWIRKCYADMSDEQKANTPTVVTASFIVGKFGQVKRLSFKESINPKSGIQRCFTDKLLPKSFPHTESGKAVRIKFPVKFN